MPDFRFEALTLPPAADVQFGKQIGKFQAIQHMLAVAAWQFAAASAAVDALTETPGLADDLVAIAMAKARAGEAAGVVAACHQVHGAMGSRTSTRCISSPAGFGPGATNAARKPVGSNGSAA